MLTREEFQESHIGPVLAGFREADRAEVWASGQQLPEEALRGSISDSRYFLETLLWHGEPVAIFGVGHHDRFGVPWMLSTESITEWGKPFIKLGKEAVLDMSDMYSHLVNFIDSRNEVSIKWLRFVGFTIEFDSPIEIRGVEFYKFWRIV